MGSKHGGGETNCEAGTRVEATEVCGSNSRLSQVVNFDGQFGAMCLGSLQIMHRCLRGQGSPLFASYVQPALGRLKLTQICSWIGSDEEVNWFDFLIGDRVGFMELSTMGLRRAMEKWIATRSASTRYHCSIGEF